MIKADKVLIGDIGVIILILGALGFISALLFKRDLLIWALITMATGVILMLSEGETGEDTSEDEEEGE